MSVRLFAGHTVAQRWCSVLLCNVAEDDSVGFCDGVRDEYDGCGVDFFMIM